MPGDEGIVFASAGGQGQGVRASWRNVTATRLATVLEGPGFKVQTVEHLMSAFSALRLWQARVEIEGPELPILDGSAAPFLAALRPHVAPSGTIAPLKVLRPVSVRQKDAFATLIPFKGRRFDVGIDFADAAIGIQRVVCDLTTDTFARDIAPARTFGRLKDVKAMRRAGYGRGASLENAVAVDGPRVINPEGLRFADEFARHKLLDAVGDLALAERPILGCYRAHKAGHRLNFKLLEALFADPQNYQIVI